ncbi:40S ribosomal protein S4-C [Spatholobus suberectus]|nr:40S ribosomal protein S4-C [Spatholobus suberectus]
MEASELDEGMKVLDSCLAHINWRLKPSSKRRLQLDILALTTRMRAVVMIDYGGIMPQLQHHLSSLLQLALKVLLHFGSLVLLFRRLIFHLHFQESPIFEHVRLMVIQDMIYLIHVTELAHHVRSSLNSQQPLLFVDLEHEPPKMITQIEESQLAMQLLSIQRLFLTIFSPEGIIDPSPSQEAKCTGDANATCQSFPSLSSVCIDLSNCMDNTHITVPTLNGWLLGYPVVYLFGKEHIADAIYNLSTKYLHIFQVLVCRNSTLKKGTQVEELLSFSVPYDLSMRGSNEQWAEAFLAHMQAKWERCANAWKSLKMEVSECHPQAIVL